MRTLIGLAAIGCASVAAVIIMAVLGIGAAHAQAVVIQQADIRQELTSTNAPDITPTAPCMGSRSVAGAWLGGTLGGGSTWTSKDCSIRETARLFYSIGLTSAAVEVLCQSKYARNVQACAPFKRKVAPSPRYQHPENRRQGRVN